MSWEKHTSEHVSLGLEGLIYGQSLETRQLQEIVITIAIAMVIITNMAVYQAL